MDIHTWLAAKFSLTGEERRMPIELPNATRETLAHWFHVWGFLTGAEVGVERGMYSEVLCRENPGVKLHCVDAWTAYRGYRDHVDQEKLDRFYVETGARLQGTRAELHRAFSVDAAATFAPHSLDFVYLDGNHRIEQVIADLTAWAPRVRPGGVIAGHDFTKAHLPSLMHVPQAICAWTDAYEIHPWYVVGRRDRVEGEIRDDGRSWFYVQPEPVSYSGKIKQ